MNALRAELSDYITQDEDGAFAPHDPAFKRAVDAVFDLDDKGKRLNLEISDKPYEALIRISQELHNFGVANNLASEFVDAIEAQAVHLGVDFTKKEKPTPMTIALRVVDEEPVLDPGKTHFMVAWDRDGKHGGEYSQMMMKLGINGTQSSHTNVPKFEELFAAGKKQYLIAHFEKLEGEGVGSLDQAGVAMATLVEAVGVAAAESRGAEEIKQAIEAGTIAPEMKELIAAVAEVNKLVEAAKTPGAVENVEAKMAELKAVVIELTNAAAKADGIPSVVAKAIVAAHDKGDTAVNASPAAASVDVKAQDVPVPQNDNVVAVPVLQTPEVAVAPEMPNAAAPVPEVAAVADAKIEAPMMDVPAASAVTIDTLDTVIVDAKIEAPIVEAVDVSKVAIETPAADTPIAAKVDGIDPVVVPAAAEFATDTVKNDALAVVVNDAAKPVVEALKAEAPVVSKPESSMAAVPAVAELVRGDIIMPAAKSEPVAVAAQPVKSSMGLSSFTPEPARVPDMKPAASVAAFVSAPASIQRSAPAAMSVIAPVVSAPVSQAPVAAPVVTQATTAKAPDAVKPQNPPKVTVAPVVLQQQNQTVTPPKKVPSEPANTVTAPLTTGTKAAAPAHVSGAATATSGKGAADNITKGDGNPAHDTRTVIPELKADNNNTETQKAFVTSKDKTPLETQAAPVNPPKPTGSDTDIKGDGQKVVMKAAGDDFQSSRFEPPKETLFNTLDRVEREQPFEERKDTARHDQTIEAIKREVPSNPAQETNDKKCCDKKVCGTDLCPLFNRPAAAKAVDQKNVNDFVANVTLENSAGNYPRKFDFAA